MTTIKEPYRKIFSELKLEFQKLGFQEANESAYGITFGRGDDFLLRVSVERYSDTFSVGLERLYSGAEGRLSPECLMEAISPKEGTAATAWLQRFGSTEQGISGWWKTFLAFLQAHEGLVFTYPLVPPYRERYERCCSEKLSSMGLEEFGPRMDINED